MAERQFNDPEEAFPGKDLGSREFVATDEMLNNYFEGLEIDPSRYDKNTVPSMILTNVDGGFSGAGFKNNFGTLWMRQQWEINAPIVANESYNITSKVVDVYEHRNRTVANQEVTLWAPDGSQVAQGHHHQSFMINQSSGKVALRDPKTKGGVRRFEIPAGDAVEPVDAVISLEMCGKFFHGNANYHTNKEAALELGFEEVVVGGRMTLSYMGDMMDKQFGKGWYEGGSLDIKFTNIVWPDDHIIAKGVITGTEQENGDTKASVAVWMEKEDGTVVIVGNATTLV